MRRIALLCLSSIVAACGSPTPASRTATAAPAPHASRAIVEPPPERPHDPEAERLARVEMERCGVTEELPALYPRTEEDEEYSSLSVSRDPDGTFLVRFSESGNGVDAEHGGFDELFDPRTCARLRFEWGSTDGDIRRDVAFVWRNRGAPTQEEIVRLARAQPADGAGREHAFARMRLSTRCPGFEGEPRLIDPERTWDVLGPLVAPQPWVRGVPAQAVGSFWTEALLESVGASDDEEEEDGDPPPSQRLEGAVVPSTGRPERVRSIGALELWAAEHEDRNGAVSLALYDPARDRHRWIALTRGCVNGTSIEWIAEDGDLLIGRTHSRHPVYEEQDGVIVIDASSAQAFVLEQEGAALALPLERRAASRTPAETAAWAELRARLRAIAAARRASR